MNMLWRFQTHAYVDKSNTTQEWNEYQNIIEARITLASGDEVVEAPIQDLLYLRLSVMKKVVFP